MKKLIAAILSLVIVATIALPAAAQERDRNYANQGSSRKFDDQRNRDRRRSDGDYRDGDDNQGQRTYYNYKGDDGRSFWQNNHRLRDHRY